MGLTPREGSTPSPGTHMRKDNEKRNKLKDIFFLNSAPQPTLDELLESNPQLEVWHTYEPFIKKIIRHGTNGYSCEAWLDSNDRPIRIVDGGFVNTFFYDEEGYLAEEEELAGLRTIWIKKYLYATREGGAKQLCKYIYKRYDRKENLVELQIVDFDSDGNPLI